MRLLLMLSLVAVAPLAAVAISSTRDAAMRRQCAAEELTLAATCRDAQDVLQLRALRQHVDERRRPEQDMISRVHAALQASSIPVGLNFKSLRLDSDAAVPGMPAYRRESVSVALGHLSLEQLGGFLLNWRQSQPLWTPMRLELTHSRENGPSDAYDVTLVFSTLYVAEGGVS